MPHGGTMSLDIMVPTELPGVLRKAAEVYRGAGELERQCPAATTVWDGMAKIMDDAASAAEGYLRETYAGLYGNMERVDAIGADGRK